MQRQHLRPILRAALIAAALATAVIATAGSLGLKTDKAPKQHRNHQPRLVTMEGVLQQDRLGSWVLDGKVPLSQSEDLRWVEERDARASSPAAGRSVRLLGQWYGGVFKIRHATLISSERMVSRQVIMPIAPPAEDYRPLPE